MTATCQKGNSYQPSGSATGDSLSKTMLLGFVKKPYRVCWGATQRLRGPRSRELSPEGCPFTSKKLMVRQALHSPGFRWRRACCKKQKSPRRPCSSHPKGGSCSLSHQPETFFFFFLRKVNSYCSQSLLLGELRKQRIHQLSRKQNELFLLLMLTH